MCKKRRMRQGFTLTELLVVIGIIALLISILIPTISSVRQSAYNTSTQQQIMSIAGAIDRYYADFGAYPGPIPDSQLGGTSASAYTCGGVGLNPAPTIGTTAVITPSENLVLALLGGLRVTPTAATPPTVGVFGYYSAEVKNGPCSLNPANPKRYQPYLDVPAIELSTTQSNSGGTAAIPGDTNIPEFVDRFPDPLPIIYLRAKPGALSVANNTGTLQYNTNHALAYGFWGTGATSDTKPSVTDFPDVKDSAGNVVLSNGWPSYFGNGSLSTTTTPVAMQKDGYILISAGADRKYGTKDDIFNFTR